MNSWLVTLFVHTHCKLPKVYTKYTKYTKIKKEKKHTHEILHRYDGTPKM